MRIRSIVVLVRLAPVVVSPRAWEGVLQRLELQPCPLIAQMTNELLDALLKGAASQPEVGECIHTRTHTHAHTHTHTHTHSGQDTCAANS